MKELLSDFLQKTQAFTKREILELIENMDVIKVKKNTIIVKEGQVCNSCYFVLKGCLRQYVIADGVEKTIAFYTEEDAVNFFTSYSNKTASTNFLCSLEESVLLVGNPEKDLELFNKFPKLELITQKMLQINFGNVQDNFARFMTSSPEERYLQMLKEKPNLLQRAPLNQIASYLGITPESLSRMRKRLFRK